MSEEEELKALAEKVEAEIAKRKLSSGSSHKRIERIIVREGEPMPPPPGPGHGVVRVIVREARAAKAQEAVAARLAQNVDNQRSPSNPEAECLAQNVEPSHSVH